MHTVTAGPALLDDVVAAAKAAQAPTYQLPSPRLRHRRRPLHAVGRQAAHRHFQTCSSTIPARDATSAIDVTTEEAIHEALETLMTGRTTLVIAHRLSTIGLADRVVLLEDGHIVASGAHSELLATEPRYAEVLAHAEDAVDPDDTIELDGEPA
jgi:ATP-binding cassette subfamily B protein